MVSDILPSFSEATVVHPGFCLEKFPLTTTSCPTHRPTTLWSSPNKPSRRISGLHRGIHQTDQRHLQKWEAVQNEVNSRPNPELPLLHQPTHRTWVGPTRCVLAEKSRYHIFLSCIDINSLSRGYRTQDPRYRELGRCEGTLNPSHYTALHAVLDRTTIIMLSLTSGSSGTV